MSVSSKGKYPNHGGLLKIKNTGRRGILPLVKSNFFPDRDRTENTIWNDWLFGSSAATAALTGTITASVNEADIVTGGKTLIITLTGDTWVTSGATFDGQRANIIAGIDSGQSEATGWDAVVKAGQGVAGVVRTSDTVVTITWDAFATYNITAQETITVTIPSTALTLGASVIAAPTFTVATYTPVTSSNQYFMMMGVG